MAIRLEDDNKLTKDFLDRIFLKSSENMSELPDRSIHLAVTSPPYNVGKAYDSDLSISEYRDLLSRVFREVFRVLVDGGRLCVNIANIGRKPYIPVHSFLISDLVDKGYLMRGEIIWNKGSSAGASTAWGSWRSASNPALRDVHEYILVFSKSTYSRSREGKQNSIGKQEFLEFTKSIWDFPAESASRIGHPAPFPLELARRCIELYSFQDDVILDPFCGSGTTCIAALEANRSFVGYEINEQYVQLALNRISGKRGGSKQKEIKLAE